MISGKGEWVRVLSIGHDNDRWWWVRSECVVFVVVFGGDLVVVGEGDLPWVVGDV